MAILEFGTIAAQSTDTVDEHTRRDATPAIDGWAREESGADR
jgi:hypothetical protein